MSSADALEKYGQHLIDCHSESFDHMNYCAYKKIAGNCPECSCGLDDAIVDAREGRATT